VNPFELVSFENCKRKDVLCQTDTFQIGYLQLAIGYVVPPHHRHDRGCMSLRQPQPLRVLIHHKQVAISASGLVIT
jgi:hypothetical protein